MAAVVAKKSPPRRTFVGDELLLRLKFFASRRTYGVPQVVDGRLDRGPLRGRRTPLAGGT